MPVDREHSRRTIQKLSRELSRLAVKLAPESVHRFRTYSRRVEALLDEFLAEPTRSDKKLLKQLARLRKKAGRVRDLDVQITALRSLKIPQEPARKSQLTHALAEERVKREKKLAKAFDEGTVSTARKRLKRAASGLGFPNGTDPLRSAMRRMARLGSDSPVTEKLLHQYRIAGKRARYIAELAANDPEAQRFIEQLKRMQDVIGDWHDWLKLTQRAEELFGDTQALALLAALRNVTRAKFRQALDALVDVRAALSRPVSVPAAPGRRPPAKQADKTTAAVA